MHAVGATAGAPPVRRTPSREVRGGEWPASAGTSTAAGRFPAQA